MTHQEVLSLGVAAICLITNCLGAAFTIRRVHARKLEQQSSHINVAYPSDRVRVQAAFPIRYVIVYTTINIFASVAAFFASYFLRDRNDVIRRSHEHVDSE